MICPQCHQEIQEIANGAGCPECQGRTPSFRSYGAPTLIRGVSAPDSAPARRLAEYQRPLLWPLVWLGLALIITFFLWAAALAPERGVIRSVSAGASPALRQVAAPVVQPVVQSEDTGTTRLVIRVPARRWIDTGIDMCGCVHFNVEARGKWKTPSGLKTGLQGVPGHSRDRLAQRQPYGSLIAKVGTDPYMLVGSSRVIDGEDFNSDGTLKLGMNARKNKPVDRSAGTIFVIITGHFNMLHAPR